MSKIYSALAGLCLSVLALGAQPAAAQVTPPHYVRCGTQEADDAQQQELKRLNPNYNPAKLSYNRGPLPRTTINYTLPVVVHVINSSEAVGVGTNLSQAQVQSQLDVLNEDYRKLNPDGATVVPSAFQPVRADAMVQFVAARVDPNGNPMAEPGIDRVDRNVKGWTAPPYVQTYIQATIKPATSWDPSRYVNIWVMNLGGGLLGYAQFPDNTAGLGGLSASGGASNTDGVVILYSAYGSRAKVPSGTYTTSYDKGRTLTHELGHWLGLRHIWGDATCGTDYCNDTPTQQTSNYGCPTYPHVTCSNAGDQSMNYMDYVDDACMAMFSADQVARIQAVMVGTPRRASLATSNVGCPNGVATATAANNGPVCAGGTINLTATGPAGATYAWTGPNGYTSTQQNPTLTNVTTSMSGAYNVTVSVTTGACAGNASTSVVVNPAAPTPTLATTAANVCPGTTATLSATNLASSPLINENFNGAATGWTIGNTGTASTAFQYVAAPYSYSSTYFALSNYSLDGTRFALANSDAGGSGSVTNTTLVSPVFSTTGYSTLQVVFQQYLPYGPGDAATVEVSTNGGTTWTTVTSYTTTQGTATAPATTTLNLNAYANRASLQLRWHYVANWSNAWAIDNVSVTDASPPITYAWSLVNGNGLPTTVNAATLVVSPTVASVYRLTANYTGSPCTATATIAIGVSAGPTPVTVSNSGPVCAGSTVTLTASTIANTTYAWTGPNGYTSTQQNPVLTNVTVAMAGTYTVTTGTAGSSCSSTASTTVVINPAPPTPTLAATATSVCAGNSSTISASNLAGQTGLVYTWTLVSGNGLPTATTAATLTVTPTTPSVYRLTLGYAGSPCTSTATISINATQPLPTIMASSNSPTCAGSTLTLSATSIANATYAWTGPNGYTSTQQNPTLTNATVAMAGTYTVTASVAGNNCVSTATTTVNVLPVPVLAASSATVALGSPTTLSATNLTGQTGLVYTWTLVSGSGLPTVTNTATIAVNPTQASVYKLTVGYAGGSCTTSATISIGVSVSQWTASAYPVPFRADGVSVLVDTDAAGPLTVRMYDIMGRKVYDQDVTTAVVGRNTVLLPNSGSLQTGKYVIVVEQSGHSAHINVLRDAF